MESPTRATLRVLRQGERRSGRGFPRQRPEGVGATEPPVEERPDRLSDLKEFGRRALAFAPVAPVVLSLFITACEGREREISSSEPPVDDFPSAVFSSGEGIPQPVPRPVPDDLEKFVSAVPQQPERQAVIGPQEELEPTGTATPTTAEIQQEQQAQTIPESGIYVVRLGENLTIIADKLGLTADQLMEWNPRIIDPNQVGFGQSIIVDPERAGMGGEIVVPENAIIINIQSGFSQKEVRWVESNIRIILDNLVSIIGGNRGEILVERGFPGESDTAAWVYGDPLGQRLGTLKFRQDMIVGEEDEFGRDSYWLVAHELTHLLVDPFSEEMAKLFNLDDAHEFIIKLGEIVSIRSGGAFYAEEMGSWPISQALARDPEIFRKLFEEYQLRGRPSLSSERWIEITNQVSPRLVETVLGRYFSETGFYVKDEFLESWTGVDGPPISDGFSYQGDDDVYQYFRNTAYVFSDSAPLAARLLPGAEDTSCYPNICPPDIHRRPLGWYLYKSRPDGSLPRPGDVDWVNRKDFNFPDFFADFVSENGGEKVFGVPISPLIETEHGYMQWTTYFCLEWNGQEVAPVPLGEIFRNKHDLNEMSAFIP